MKWGLFGAGVLVVGRAEGPIDILSAAPTVVSLYAKGAAPKSSTATSQWTEEIRIKGKMFTCSLSQDVDRNRLTTIVEDRFDMLAPIAGFCDDIVCPNDRVELPDGRVLEVSSSPDHAGLGFQVFVDPTSKKVGAVLECDYASLPPPRRVQKRCRAGTGLPEYRVVTHTFSNNTVEVRSTRSMASQPVVVPMESVGCESVGALDPGDLFAVTNVSTRPDGLVDIRIVSPLCREEGSAKSGVELLEPIRTGCFVGGFMHRQFEVCFGATVAHDLPDFRAVQLLHRANHPWPSAITLKPVSGSDWSYDGHSRRLVRTVATSQNCRSFQPFLGEQFLVTIEHPRMSLKAVGGPFTPIIFPENADGVEGVLWFDPQHPKACTEMAFKGHPEAPWIAVAERGDCMFQEKSLMAQKHGAVGIVIVNNLKRAMIPAMAGVPGKPAVDIPAVLVDSEGVVLKQLNGVKARITSHPLPGSPPPGLSETITVKTRMGCFEQMEGTQCQIGDQVILELDGEDFERSGRIIDRINAELFYVKLDHHEPPELVPGWLMFKSSDSPCTAQSGTFITHISRTDTCELTVDVHSELLCPDQRFKEPILHKQDVVCEVL